MNTKLSSKLAELTEFFNKRRDCKSTLPGSSSAMIAQQLDIMVAISLSMEQELHAFRLIEANRAGRKFMEDEAAEALKPAVLGGGKVLRPDFRRKS